MSLNTEAYNLLTLGRPTIAVCSFIFNVVDEIDRRLGMDTDRVKEDFETNAEQSRLIETIANIFKINNFICTEFSSNICSTVFYITSK